MKKRKLLSFITVLTVTALILTGCYGVNGNPNELTGTWVYTRKYSDTYRNKPAAEIYTYTLTVNSDGTAVVTEKYEDYRGYSEDYSRTDTYTGTIIGSVTSSPKTFVFNVTGEKRDYVIDHAHEHLKDSDYSVKYSSSTIKYDITYLTSETQMFVSEGGGHISSGLYIKKEK